MARVLGGLVAVYQATTSGLVAHRCRFFPSCSAYARVVLAEQPLGRALALLSWRLLRCHPLAAGGPDPPPRPSWPGAGRAPLSRGAGHE